MSDKYISNQELIEVAIDSIQASCQSFCVGDCNCDKYEDLLKERFLNV